MHDRHATILCPGPSFAAFVREFGEHPWPLGGVVIGVNTAVEDHPCDWWVVGDPDAAPGIRPVRWERGAGGPRLFTPASKCDKLEPDVAREIQRHDPLTYEQTAFTPTHLHPNTFSSVAALFLAAHLGALIIDVFGVDWRGQTDYRGDYSDARNPNRWREERRQWCRASHVLQERGICAVRQTCEPPEVPPEAPPEAPLEVEQPRVAPLPGAGVTG